MNWLTQNEIKAAAKKSLKAAKACSLQHWQQLRQATPKELFAALNHDDVEITVEFCALCQRYLSGHRTLCRRCPLGKAFEPCNTQGSAWCSGSEALIDCVDCYEGLPVGDCKELWKKWHDACDKMIGQLEAIQ